MCDCGFPRGLGIVLALLFLNTYPAQAQEPAPSAEQFAAAQGGESLDLGALSPEAFLRLLIARSVEVRYSKLSADVAQHLRQGESAQYEPTAFIGIREEGRNRQRTPDERLQNTFTTGTAILDEKAHSDEVGIRSKLPTGAEVSVSYKAAGKNNNLISKTSTFDTEYTTLLNLTLKQPLLRNAGRTITETDQRIAVLEHKVALQQLIQQTQKTGVDGLTLYWQLHRAQETVKLRKEAIASTEALIEDTSARISAGRVPAGALLELRGVMLNRQAELTRSQQALREAQSKVSTALNVEWRESRPTYTSPKLRTVDTSTTTTMPGLDELLNVWSPYRIALLKQQQAQIRLNFAKNQTLPLVDLVMSYGGTGFNNKLADASKVSTDGTYPDWYVGVNFEVPLGGNRKAQQQYLAQSTRLTQTELEVQAIRTSLSNDIFVRYGDLQNAIAVMELSSQEIQLRQSIFNNERQRVQLGSGSLGNLIQKQVDFIESRQRLLENQVRYEVALAMWQYTNGSLLIENGIEISEQATLDE